ncbi:phosphoribosylamine--glycine ligase [candidate division WOR-3 bacterium]|uniref:Phosphoribosylamine--glycine ligase n=1 Tax=candidate division WOR-3 bacterium TaxID=2052148 RepID=A0A9D5QDI6_UNCW3|nr:phosphoribosylamine--glycine ligase [candidate division WOR-3 bacterium]MBD3365096.1 phosphoribosylamine--glycine ligase [candidate division WOR-3 bacterium]
MKVFILGGGGREHALGWKMAQSPEVKGLYFSPGNAGTSELGTNINANPADVETVLTRARELKPDLIVVGPEAPLFAGVADRLEEEGFLIFGPKKRAAMLEQEKAYAKDFMQRHNIPTASFKVFDEAAAARRYIEGKESALVVKASGPALGKGVIVCDTPEEALAAVDKIMVEKKFGPAGEEIVIEECLEGEELSLHILTDGKRVLSFPASQDHKPVGEGDEGPNTGGMGAYAPASLVDAGLQSRIDNEIVEPVLAGLEAEDIDYRGLLYIGLMITEKGPQVLEFNCRFGDPETQPLMLLADEELVPLLTDTARGRLSKSRKIKTKKGYSLCVVAASAGYPGAYKKGKRISLGKTEGVVCFHAGTRHKDGEIVTSGGRVLGVTAFSPELKDAKIKAYEALDEKIVGFEGMYYRRDIGDKGLRKLEGRTDETPGD